MTCTLDSSTWVVLNPWTYLGCSSSLPPWTWLLTVALGCLLLVRQGKIGRACVFEREGIALHDGCVFPTSLLSRRRNSLTPGALPERATPLDVMWRMLRIWVVC